LQPQDGSYADDAKQKFPEAFFCRFRGGVGQLAATGLVAFATAGRDRSYAKDSSESDSWGEFRGRGHVQLDVCLLQYALVKGDDAFRGS